ncbi:hypothetical protein PC111_g23422 [Phytophthora cactorum]|nr:hypothetical protein PC111_g23422 [Phytophthora cactorum]
MSENALLIDLMEARASHQEAHSARGFHQKLLKLPDLPPSGCRDNCSHVVDWIDSELRSLDRVEAYSQVFQTDETSTPRTNVYGILRASPLADGKEAIVLVTQYRNVGADSGENSGLSLGLALLKYLSRVKWLAKDVILLAADDGYLDGSDGYAPGTEAWLQAYHLDPIESGLQGGLSMRAGVIRAAVNLETLYGSRCPRVPSTPNSYDSGSLSEEYTPPEFKERARNYLTNLKGMLHFMTTLATGPSGPHANFISYNIDSITLSLTKSQTSGGRPLASRDVLRSIEMVVRALSNLEEKLHQSFFLYVLPSTSTFVSVGEYIYVVLLVISPAIAHLLYLANQTTGMRVALSLTVFLVVETLCVLLLVGISKNFATPTALLQTFSSSNTSATRWFELAIAISVTQALTILVVMPTLRSVAGFSGCVEIYDWRKKVTTYEAEEQSKLLQESTKATEKTVVDTKPDANNDIPKLDSGWRAIKFFTMVVIVYAHCIMGILNYPMALFCAIPMAHFARVVPFGTATLPKNVWNGLWLFLSSPLVLLILLNWSRLDVVAGLSYAVDSFVQRVNLLALAYICCIYIPAHTLSLVVWTYPSVPHSGKKQKLE